MATFGRRPGLVLAALAFGLAGACGGGGGSPTQPLCIDFAAAAAPANGTVVATRGTASTCDTVQVELSVTGVNDVFGANFVLNYDPAKVRYAGLSTTGSLLADGGVTVLQQVGTTAGAITVGLSRQAATGVDVTSTRLLARVLFRSAASAPATDVLALGNTALLDSQAPPQPIPGVTWSGGTFTIAR